MVTTQEIERQLKKIGVSFRFLGNAEIRELRHILIDGELIEHCVLGRYEGGYAVLCATNLRLLLIDKKPFYLTLEDVRYDMIIEIDFSYRLLDATIRVCTPNKTLRFTAYKKPILRLITGYVQNKVIEVRQQSVLQAVSNNQLPISSTVGQPDLHLEAATQHQKQIKGMAKTAIGGATHKTYHKPIFQLRQTINPYTQSSFMMRQRISRF